MADAEAHGSPANADAAEDEIKSRPNPMAYLDRMQAARAERRAALIN